MATPALSVLLPFRDAESTLQEALDSVLCQDAVGLEVVAVDDGSRDASAERARRVAARHPGVRLLESGGRGPAVALQAAMGAARAPLLARMDADDVSHPERFARQLDALAAEPSLAVLGTRVRAFPEGEVGEGWQRYVAWLNGLTSADDHRRQLFVESPLCHPSVVMRREAVERVGGYRDGAFPEDYDLWLRLDAAGMKLAKLPEVLLSWRHRKERATERDPRYALERFTALKAPFLAARLAEVARPLTVWGAGRTGRRLLRALEPHGVRAARFVDIDPKKIGGRARGAPVVAPDALAPPGQEWIVVAVGARGARDLVRAALDARGHREGEHYLCAS